MRRVLRGLLVPGLVAATACLGLPAASAADGGMLRLAHLSPDAPSVDVYVDNVADPSVAIMLPGVGYGAVSDYRQVPSGTYTVSMRAAGAEASTPPVLSTTVEVGADSAHTVAGVGFFASLGLKVLEDDLEPPPAGQARARVVAAAGTAKTLDVSVAGAPPIASGLAFGQASDYVDVPGGATTLELSSEGGAPVQLPVTVDAGSVYSILVLDRPGGGLTVKTALDAASMDVMPVGGVQTGGGGTAGGGTPRLVALGVALLACAGLVGTFRVRSARRPARHGARS